MKIYTLRLLKNTRHYMFRTFTLALLACHFPLGAGIFLDINTNTDQLIFTVDGGSSISSGTFNQWFVDDGNVQNQTFAEFLTITDFTKTGGTGLSSSSDVNDFRRTVLLKLFQKSLRLPLQIHALRVVFLSFSLCPSVFLYGFKMHLRASQGPLEGA